MPGEQIVHATGLNMSVYALAQGALGIAAVSFISALCGEDEAWTLSMICLVISFCLYLSARLDIEGTIFVVTSQRLLVHRGVFSHDSVSLPLQQVASIEVNQGPYDRACNRGIVKIVDTGGTSYEYVEVDSPDEFRRAAMEAMFPLSGAA